MVSDIASCNKDVLVASKVTDERHTFASLVISTKAPVTNVSALLGHSSTQQTLETYAHLFNHELAENMNSVSDLIEKNLDGKNSEAA